MRMLSTPIYKLIKPQHVQAAVGLGLDDSQSNSNTEKLNSGWTVQDEPPARPRAEKCIKYTGLGFAALSLLCAVFAAFYVPIFLIAPTKFCMLLSGCMLSALISALCLQGKDWVKSMLLEGEAKFYSLALFAANVMGLVAAWYDMGSIACLVFALLQLMALSYVLLIRVPHGKACLDSFYKNIGVCCTALGRKLFKRSN